MSTCEQEASAARAGFSRLGVFCPKEMFSNGKGLLVEDEGLLRLVPQFVQTCEISKAYSRFNVPVSSLLASNSQGALVEWLGSGFQE